jgi:hypothetical protein
MQQPGVHRCAAWRNMVVCLFLACAASVLRGPGAPTAVHGHSLPVVLPGVSGGRCGAAVIKASPRRDDRQLRRVPVVGRIGRIVLPSSVFYLG